MAAHHTRLNGSCNGEISDAGQIQLIFGPMFSGKTTELMRRLKRYQIANYSCLRIKYAHDDRYDALLMSTHDNQKMEAVSATELSTLTEKALTHNVIGIDEGQFFPDVTAFSEWMANHGKIVIIAALDGTYQKKGFGDILNLVPLSESVVKLNAVCMLCYKDAPFTQRRGAETEIEVIGGADKYLAVCRSCYVSPPNLSNQNASHKKHVQSTNQRAVLSEVENKA